MAELNEGAKVVYGTFVGTIKQMLGEDECVILLGAPQADGAMTVIAKVDKVELVTSGEPSAESPVEVSPQPEVPESKPESTETAEESAEEKPS